MPGVGAVVRCYQAGQWGLTGEKKAGLDAVVLMKAGQLAASLLGNSGGLQAV